MKNWILKCCAALSLVPALVAVPSPAHAGCAVSIVESGLILAEGSADVLHLRRFGCEPGDYEIRTSPNPTWDFGITVLQAEIRVEAIDDGSAPETTDELVVEVWQGGQRADSATVTILGAAGPYTAIVTACDVKGREIGLLAEMQVWWGQSGDDIEFRYDLIDGTAKAWQDYTPVIGGTGVIKHGQLSAHIPIEVYADALVEDEEYLLLRLRWVSGAVIADEIAVITIEANAT